MTKVIQDHVTDLIAAATRFRDEPSPANERALREVLSAVVNHALRREAARHTAGLAALEAELLLADVAGKHPTYADLARMVRVARCADLSAAIGSDAAAAGPLAVERVATEQPDVPPARVPAVGGSKRACDTCCGTGANPHTRGCCDVCEGTGVL